MLAQELAQDLADSLRMTLALGNPLVLLRDGKGAFRSVSLGGAAVLFPEASRKAAIQ